MSQGMHKLRSISSKDPTLCQFRQLPCFCVACIDGDLGVECDNKHVSKWTLTRLKPKNSSKVRQMMSNSNEEIEIGISEEWIVDNLRLGDNTVVPSDTNEPFWIMLVDKGFHFVASNFEDGWGNKW